MEVLTRILGLIVGVLSIIVSVSMALDVNDSSFAFDMVLLILMGALFCAYGLMERRGIGRFFSPGSVALGKQKLPFWLGFFVLFILGMYFLYGR